MNTEKDITLRSLSPTYMEGRLSGILKQLMHSETEGNWLLNLYFPLKKGLCTRLVYREDY